MMNSAERFAWTNDNGLTVTRSAGTDTDPDAATYESKAGVKRVKDADYWGAPVGTIIVPGMRAARSQGGANGVRKFLAAQKRAAKKKTTTRTPKKTAARRPAGRTGGSGKTVADSPRVITEGVTKRPAAARARALSDAWGDRVEAGSRDFRRRGASNRDYEEAYVSKAELSKARAIAIERASTKAPQPDKTTIARNKWIIKEYGGPGTGKGDIRGSSFERSKRSWSMYVNFGGFDAKSGKDKGYVPCLGCGIKMSWHDNPSYSPYPKFEQDKIITTGDGGSYNPQNLMPLCSGCNNKRGASKLWDIPAFGKEARPKWFDAKFEDMVKRTRPNEKAKANRPRGEYAPVPMPVPPGNGGGARAIKSEALSRAESLWHVRDSEELEDQGVPSTGDRVTANLWNFDGRYDDVEAGIYAPDVEDAGQSVVGTLYVEEVDSAFGKYTRHVVVGDQGEIRHVEPETIQLVAKSPDYRDPKLFTKTRARTVGLLLELETKRGLRRVRTPEGVEKYGLPIGTIIGKTPRPKKAKKRKSPKVDAMRGGSRRMTVGSANFKKPTAKEVAAFKKWASKQAVTVDTPNSYTVGKEAIAKVSDMKYGSGTTEVNFRNLKANVKLIDRPGETVAILDIYTGSRGASSQSITLYGKNFEEAWQAAGVQLHRIWNRANGEGDEYDAEGFWPANRSPRTYDALPEYWEGVRGVDWYDEGDNTSDSLKARKELVNKEAAELGYKWEDLPSGSSYASYLSRKKIGVWAKETSNGVMRAHESQYPGFSKLIPRLVSGKYQKSIGWNGNGQGEGIRKSDGLPWVSQMTVIGLNPDWFGEDYEDHELQFESLARSAKREGGPLYRWHAVDYGALAEEMGVDKYEATLIAVLTHEIGHTVGNILQNRIYKDGKLGYATDWEDDNATVGNFHREELLDLLFEFGILKDGPSAKELSNPRVYNSSMQERDFSLAEWSPEAVAYHVSAYGATNISELFAETWASYQLDSNPTQFVQELGALMDKALTMFLDEETGDRVDFKSIKLIGELEIS